MIPYLHDYSPNAPKNILDGFCTIEEELVHNLKCFGIEPVKSKIVGGVKLYYYKKYDYNLYAALAEMYSPRRTIATNSV